MSKSREMDKLKALILYRGEGDRRRALYELADAFSYREEPCAAKLRDAVETLDFSDLGDTVEIFEDMDPLIVARAVTMLAALVANELGWARSFTDSRTTSAQARAA
jgi:hypothetical protein